MMCDYSIDKGHAETNPCYVHVFLPPSVVFNHHTEALDSYVLRAILAEVSGGSDLVNVNVTGTYVAGGVDYFLIGEMQ